jgi:tellurite resistance protein TehA-like permease
MEYYKNMERTERALLIVGLCIICHFVRYVIRNKHLLNSPLFCLFLGVLSGAVLLAFGMGMILVTTPYQ